MEFIFDLLAEIIIEPVIEGYVLAMSHFSDGSKKLDEEKVRTVVVFESLALMAMFVVGGIMLLETSGKSTAGKIIFILSIAVSVVQILFGIIFGRLKKKHLISNKPMTTERLVDLIDRMCNEDDCSSKSISWQDYREAEKLSDTSLLPFLQNTITENKNSCKKDKKIRSSVYFIIGKIIGNSFDENACKFLIERLNVETDKYIISGILDLLVGINIPWNIDIAPIVHCAKSDKWQIRHSAIYALGSSATTESKEVLYFYLNQTDEKNYRYEIIYANASLGKIGKKEDIPVLEKHLNSRIRDIKNSAAYAIESIRKRN